MTPKYMCEEEVDTFILTVDKGREMVVLDRQNYLIKAQDLPMDKDTYKIITGDPTTKPKK